MSPASPSFAKAPSERQLIFLIGAVQFVNILDFVMVIPLGPDFARALGIPNAKLGLVGGSYTAAAAIAGLLGATFLDRFDRKRALLLALLGLAVGTAVGSLARGLPSMLGARVLAGLFGGPASAIALSIITDVIPVERRGKALGAVMGAFGAASVLGVPAGLELARQGGWRLPFLTISALGLVVAAVAYRLLPPLRGHLVDLQAKARSGFIDWQKVIPMDLLHRKTARGALLASVVIMVANFAIIPNLSAYLQFNCGYPRERLGLLYFVGGMVSFAVMRIAGTLVDRVGATPVATGGTALYVAMIFTGFVMFPPPVPLLAVFVAFMTASSFRMVPVTTLSARVPGPSERARFLSVQSAIQHLSAATGSMLSSQVLSELPDGRLVGMRKVALFSISLGAVLPLLLRRLERRLHADAKPTAAPNGAIAATPSDPVEPTPPVEPLA